MSTIPHLSFDPKQSAEQIKQESEHRLVRLGLLASLATSERDDKFSAWVLTAAGAAAGFLLAQIELLREVPGWVALLAIGLLVSSAVCGLIQKYLAHIVGINLLAGEGTERGRQILEQEQTQRMMAIIREDVRRKGDLATRDIFEDIGALVASKPDLGAVSLRVQCEVAAAQPRVLRLLARRRVDEVADPVFQLRWLVRVRARQALFVLLQLLLFLGFLTIAFAASGPVSSPEKDETSLPELTTPAHGLAEPAEPPTSAPPDPASEPPAVDQSVLPTRPPTDRHPGGDPLGTEPPSSGAPVG